MIYYVAIFRPERSLSMRLYTLDKRSFALVFIAFFLSFLCGIFIGLAGMKNISFNYIFYTFS